MTEREGIPTRRELLGAVGGASFTAIAGCGMLGDGEEEGPEFDITIVESNAPIADGGVLEVTANIENIGDEGARDDVWLRVADLEESTAVSLEPGESTELSLQGRLETDEDEEAFEALAETTAYSDLEEVTVYKPAEFEFDLIEITDELVAGEEMTVDVEVTNTGGVEGTEQLSLSVPELGEEPDGTLLTLDGGESTVFTLSWGTQDATAVDEITVGLGEESLTHEITVKEPAAFDIQVQPDSPLTYADEGFAVDLLVSNLGDIEASETATMAVDGAEVDSATVAVAGGSEAEATLTWTPSFEDIGEHTATVEGAGVSEEISIAVHQAVEVLDHEVVETFEDFGEIIQVTVRNESNQEMTRLLGGEIDFEGDSIERGELDVSFPESSIADYKPVTVQAESEKDVWLKAPVDAWAFEYFEAEYTHDVWIEASADDGERPQPHQEAFIRDVDASFDSGPTIEEFLTTEATAQSRSDRDVTVDAILTLEIADDGVDVLSERVELQLGPGESSEFEIEIEYGEYDTYFWYLEIDGVRDEPGTDAGFSIPPS